LADGLEESVEGLLLVPLVRRHHFTVARQEHVVDRTHLLGTLGDRLQPLVLFTHHLHEAIGVHLEAQSHHHRHGHPSCPGNRTKPFRRDRRATAAYVGRDGPDQQDPAPSAS
jgi:hypothetical protein